MTVPFNLISGDAKRALEVFSTEFDSAFLASDSEAWSAGFGLVNSSDAIRTTYPIPVSAAGYVERKGDDKLRSLYERSLSMTTRTWVDGFMERADIVEAPDFIGWAGEPSRIAREAARLPDLLVAELLEANANLEFYRDAELGSDLGIPLFSSVHPVNIFNTALGTFDNDHTATAIDAAMMAAAFTRFRAKKGSNGKKMRLKPTHMIVPGELEQVAKDFLENDLQRYTILEGGAGSTKNTQQTSNNRFKGIVQLVVGEDLTASDVIYLVDSTSGAYPWIVQKNGSPEQITYDKQDHTYKDAGKIGMKFVLKAAAKAALPHAIERITITG
jgi:hypothetical protein